MKAAVLERFGGPLRLTEVPDPVIGTGEVLVDVVATCVLPYTAEVFSGARNYPLEPPVIPGVGAVGRVREYGPDATRLRPGDLVWCDPTVRSRDHTLSPDITLQGWSSAGPGGLELSRYFHDGPFAEQMRVPTENVHLLGDMPASELARLSALSVYGVPYGGLLAAEFRAGETLLVSGATGNFGSAGVAVGLAMGASAVVCPGRNRTVLAELRHRFGDRVQPVVLTGEPEADTTAMTAAIGPVDVVLDLLPPQAGTATVRAAAMAVRRHGRVVLMGGVGMLGGDDLALPYPWLMRNGITLRGQWMFPSEANEHLLRMVRSGVLDLTGEAVTTFPLERCNDGVAHAAAHPGPFERTVLLPGGGA